jgi:hypothetical protein
MKDTGGLSASITFDCREYLPEARRLGRQAIRKAVRADDDTSNDEGWIVYRDTHSGTILHGAGSAVKKQFEKISRQLFLPAIGIASLIFLYILRCSPYCALRSSLSDCPNTPEAVR